MVDVTLNPIATSYASITTINDNFDRVEEGFQDSLSLSAGGTMNASIDMNSNTIYNLASPTVNHQAATKQYVDEAVADVSGATEVDLENIVVVNPDTETSQTLAEWISDLERIDRLVITPEQFGAKGDVVSKTSGGAITSTSTTFTATNTTFTSDDVGKYIVIQGAGSAGAPLATRISAFIGSTSVTLAASASTTVTSAIYAYGTDDTAAFALMEAARVAAPVGAACQLRNVIYGVSNVPVVTRVVSSSVNDGWGCISGKATIKAIRQVDTDYMVATDRWIDGDAWPSFSGAPMMFVNIRFDGNNIVDWAEVCKSYSTHHWGCEWTGGRVGLAKLTRQNQYNDVIRITADVTSGSNILTNVTFVSSTGSATSLSDIRLRQLIDGTGYVAGQSNSPFITNINTGSATLTISKNADATATGATFYINRNGAGNRYQAETTWLNGEFRPTATTTYLFKNEGTVENEWDASTDGWFVDNVVNGMELTTYGLHFGNMGGWHLSGQHTYACDYDLWVYTLGYNHVINDNEFEDWVSIGGTYGKNAIGPGNVFWEGLEIRFTDDTSTEELTIMSPRFTRFREGLVYSQLKVNTTRPNKTVVLLQPHFRTGAAATGTTPVTIVNQGTVKIIGGVDGDGLIGNRVHDNGRFGVYEYKSHFTATPAVNDVPYRVEYKGVDSALNQQVYGSHEILVTDPTSGSEDSTQRFYSVIAGVETLLLTLGSSVLSPKYIISQNTGSNPVGFGANGENAVTASLARYSADATGPAYGAYKQRGTLASPADVVQFDELGRYAFGGRVGGTTRDLAYLDSYAVATNPSAGSGDGEADLRVLLAAAGATSPTEVARFRHSTGLSMFGTNVVVDAYRGLRLRSYTAAELGDKTNAVNTAQKAKGKLVLNDTDTEVYVATGSTDTSTWKSLEDGTTITPA